MQLFLLTVIFTVLAIGLIMPRPRRGPTPEPTEPDQTPIDWEAAAADMTVLLDALRELMRHPQLGGPGFLMVQFPLSGQGTAEVSAQYPNIRETLYRKIVRRTPGEDWTADGIPVILLERRAVFTPESGGMVLVTAEAVLPEALDRQSRQTALAELSRILGERYPDMTVRVIGGDLLLTPVRKA
ncbi:MAG: hypothetical protein K2O18_17900 [Oscillospiraceae bacterium]|nr:hypothetical protein [Oscillospiraceae bacterium]